MRHRRMEIERHVERLGALEDRPEPLVVEEHAVAQAVHHGADAAEPGHRALELVGGFLGLGGRQGREGAEALGVGLHHAMHPVVALARHADRGLAGDALRRWRALRQHLVVDAGLVHLLETQRPQIVEPGADMIVLAALHVAGHRGDHVGVVIMLLERDDIRLAGHRRPRSFPCCR